ANIGIAEELWNRDGPSHGAQEAFDLWLIAAQRAKQLLLIRRGRRQAGQVIRELVHRHDRLVAAALVIGQRLLEWVDPAEAGVQRVGQQIRVTESVSDALTGDRVAVIASVANQRPAWTKWSTEEEAEVGGTPIGCLARGALHALGQPWRTHLDVAPHCAFNVMSDA